MSDAPETKKGKKKTRSFLYSEIGSGPKEAFKRLRTNIVCSFSDEKCHIVGMTSALASEGKSLISINLASSLAEIGKKVILLDADVYRPSIHKTLNVSSELGIADVANSTSSLSIAVHKYDCSENYSFDFIASGEVARNPSEVLNSPNLVKLMQKLRECYDYVVIDMPPIGSVSDVASFSRLTDGMLVVVREGHTPRSLLKECLEQLRFSKVNVLGFVMNGSLSGSGTGYSYSYGKGYGYSKYHKGYGYGYGYGYY